mmetsp:Transcript_37357/g.77510  ORF Transcript_37357/g.77510 Transcript_37357/m.77510 type:complete len:265 (+) Transcript_37357:434-1228(+)
MNSVVWSKVLKIVVERQIILNRFSDQYRCFVSPAAGNISQRVAASSQDKHWNAKGANVVNAISVSFHREIEAPESITREGIGTTLKNHSPRTENLHNLSDHRAEDGTVRFVVHSIIQREINRIIFAVIVANVRDITSARKILSKLVERTRHDTVCAVESFFHSITMMNVDINVEHTLVLLQEFKNSQNAIVDVAKSTGFCLFGVMKTSGPINDNIGLVLVESGRAPDTATRVELAKFKESIKHRTIFSHIEPLKLPNVFLHIVG